MSPWLFDAEIDYPESTNCSLLVLNKDNGIWSHLHGMMQPPNKLSFLPGLQQSREGGSGTLMAGRGREAVPCALLSWGCLKDKIQVLKWLGKKKNRTKHEMLHILSINKRLEKSRLENTRWNKVKLLI